LKKSPLDIAIEKNHSEIFKMLILKGATCITKQREALFFLKLQKFQIKLTSEHARQRIVAEQERISQGLEQIGKVQQRLLTGEQVQEQVVKTITERISKELEKERINVQQKFAEQQKLIVNQAEFEERIAIKIQEQIAKQISKEQTAKKISNEQQGIIKEQELIPDTIPDSFIPVQLNQEEEKNSGQSEEVDLLKFDSKRVSQFLSSANLEKCSTETFVDRMTDGRIPMGFSSIPLWPAAHEKLRQLPTEMKKKEKRLTAITEEAKRIEEEIRRLQGKLEQVSEQQNSLELELGAWDLFRDTKLTPLVELTASLATAEKKLNHSVDSHLANSSIEEMVSLDSDLPATDEKNSNPPKFSIIFNCAGISHNSIKKLSSVDGGEFSECDASELASSFQLPFQEKLILKELQILLGENRAPADISAHGENCVLCSAVNPREVCHLLEEHEKPFDFDLLYKFGITGRMFLALTSQDIRRQCSGCHIPMKQLVSTLSYIKKKHLTQKIET